MPCMWLLTCKLRMDGRIQTVVWYLCLLHTRSDPAHRDDDPRSYSHRIPGQYTVWLTHAHAHTCTQAHTHTCTCERTHTHINISWRQNTRFYFHEVDKIASKSSYKTLKWEICVCCHATNDCPKIGPLEPFTAIFAIIGDPLGHVWLL